MLELTQELKTRGNDITVITTWPEYNLEDGSSHNFLEKEKENGVTVLRIKTLPHHNVNYFLRAFAQLLMPFQFLWKLWKYRIRVEKCITYSPPLPLAFVGIGLRFFGVKALLNLQDLFPQNAIDLGILKNPLQIYFFRILESLSYRFSDIITVHSDGNRTMLLDQYPSLNQKINILHNWVDLDHHQKNHSIDFRKKWEITHPFIAIFAGVMGPSQYLELILKIAENIQHREELLFLLVGGGVEEERLKHIAKKNDLNNVRFENFVSRDDYSDLLKICSLGMVCLSPKNKTPVIPGKILGYMASGLPVAAFLHKSSDGHKVIENSGCGLSADSADEESCIQIMNSLLDNPEIAEMGKAGRSYAEEHFSKRGMHESTGKVVELMNLLVVFGTRPEAIKLAPLILKLRQQFKVKICVTGQHREMLDQVLSVFNINSDFDLNLMKPNQNLTSLTSGVLEGVHGVLEKEHVDWVIVQGDTTTSMAAAVAAFYKKINIAHVEAGLRTSEKFSPFPEEINRQLTSRLADIHFAPTEKNRDSLIQENIPPEKIFVTGNTVIDALQWVLKNIPEPVWDLPFHPSDKKDDTGNGS